MTTRTEKITSDMLAEFERLEREASPLPWGNGGEGSNAIWQEHPTKKRPSFGLLRPEDRDPVREKLIALVHGEAPSFGTDPGGVYADLMLICQLRNHARELIALAKVGLARKETAPSD